MANIPDASQMITIDVNQPPGLVEDFMTYTLEDNDNPPSLSITSTGGGINNQVNWTNGYQAVASSLYKVYGTGYFGDFTHTMTTLCSFMTNQYDPPHGIWAVSNGAHNLQQMTEQGAIALLWWNTGENNAIRLRLTQWQPTIGYNSVPLALNTEYQLTITRVGGTVTCDIRDTMGVLIDTLTITGLDIRTYNTIVTYASYNNPNQTYYDSGYDKDLSLNGGAMLYEDLSLYTPSFGSYLSLYSPTRVDFTALPQQTTPDVYLQSPNIVLGDFEMHYHLHIDSIDDPSAQPPSGTDIGGYVSTLFTRDITLTNSHLVNCPNGMGYVGNGLWVTIRSQWASTATQPSHIVTLSNRDNTLCNTTTPTGETSTFVYWIGNPNTAPAVDIYVKLIKTGTTLTYWLYSDVTETTLLLKWDGTYFPSAGLTINNINSPYQYLLPVATRGQIATNNWTITGYFENLIFY